MSDSVNVPDLESLRPLLLTGTRGGSDVPQSDLLPDGGSAEATLLRLAGVAALREAAGQRAVEREGDEPEAAPADERPACSHRQAAALRDVLDLHEATLLAEWLTLAGEATVRAPHRLVPVLLGEGQRSKALRPGIAAAVDQRGRWLAGLNRDWRWVFEDGSAESLGVGGDEWTTGNRAARLAALTRTRQTDPAAGRAMLQEVWDQERAVNRELFVEAMAVGLSADDEPWLAEVGEKDRSAAVRTRALDLLARLPGSAVCREATTFADGLRAPVKGKPGPKRPFSFALPVASERWEGNELYPTNAAKLGKRQAKLLDLLSRVPPAHWLGTPGVDAAGLVKAIDPTLRTAILGGLTIAALRHPSPDLGPIVVAALGTKELADLPGDRDVSTFLDDEARVKLIASMDRHAWWQMRRAFDGSSPKVSAVLIAWGTTHNEFDGMPERVHPSTLPTLMEAIGAAKTTYGLDRTLRTAQVRAAMHAAFTD